MELPTYTNIWKIEKRLYKLYDFRLPMPLPVGQLATFLAIAVPYMLILTMAGMPFSHTWVWLYVLPPGVLAWLVTRPVLEGKRLPELVLSQLRYLSEPRTWCRMAPLAERDVITVAATVWQRPSAAATEMVEVAERAPAAPTTRAHAQTVQTPVAPPSAVQAPEAQAPEAQAPIVPAMRARALVGEGAAGKAPAAQADQLPAQDGTAVPERPVWPGRPALGSPGRTGQVKAAWAPAATQPEPQAPAPAPPAEPQADTQASPAQAVARPVRASSGPDRAMRERQPGTSRAGSGAARPAFTVRTDTGTEQPLRVVERALRSSAGAPGSGWRDRVVVVPGGHRPGKPDQVQRDQARARLPLSRPARIVALGCTAGAGQTVTTLLTGQLLATLRGEPVAVLDLSPGPGSLTELARGIPRLFPGRAGVAETARGPDGPVSDRERRLQVVTADGKTDEPGDVRQLMDAVVARYPLTLADPAAAQVPRALEAADQLLLVAPASPDAGGALAMTLEWLDAHGHADLARTAVTVLNGVSEHTMVHAEKAAAVATGRCRAIVRVPWDGRLCDTGLSDKRLSDKDLSDKRLSGEGALGTAPLSANTVRAYTALAGVLVAGLAGRAVEAQPAGSADVTAAQARSADE
jgi:hypothetical protein